MASNDQRPESINRRKTFDNCQVALANLIETKPRIEGSHTSARLQKILNRFGGVDGLERKLELADESASTEEIGSQAHHIKSEASQQRATFGTSLPSFIPNNRSKVGEYPFPNEHSAARSHRARRLILLGSNPRTTTNDGHPAPTLDQFLGNPAPCWNAISLRLQHRQDVLAARPRSAQALVREQIRVLQEACARMDLDYLILFQTYAILMLPELSNTEQDREVQTAKRCLREVFPAVEDDVSFWFAGFPCSIQPDVDSLQRWMSRASGFLYAFVDHAKAMIKTYRRLFTFPSPDELEAIFPYSRLLQETLMSAILVSVWPRPMDACLFKVLEAYKMAQVNRVGIVRNCFLESHRSLMEGEDRRLMAAVKSCSKEHMDHSILPTAIHPTVEPLGGRFIASLPSVRDLGYIRTSTEQARALPESGMAVSNLPLQHRPRAGLAQQNLSKRHTASQSGFPSPAFATKPENNWQVSPWVHPQGHQVLIPPPTLPQILPDYQSNFNIVYPPQFAPEADPINIIRSTGPQSESNLRTHTTTLLCEPWKIGIDNVSRDMIFELWEENLSKLAIETPDTLGGPPIRSVNSGTQFIRLRGVKGRPKNLSEFVAGKTHWPSSMVVLLNGRPVSFRRKPEYPSTMAVDVTSWVRPGTNILTVSFHCSGPASKKFRYLLALEVVEVAHIADMRAVVSPNGIEIAEDLLHSWFQGTDDSEDQITLDQLDVTITDPYTLKIPDTPVKSVYCTHLQCFDLDVFLHSRPKDLNSSKEFVCPLCGKDARPESLEIDSWMMEVIQELKANDRHDAKVITVTPDLRWVIKEDGSSRKSKGGSGVRGNGRDGQAEPKIVQVIELE